MAIVSTGANLNRPPPSHDVAPPPPPPPPPPRFEPESVGEGVDVYIPGTPKFRKIKGANGVEVTVQTDTVLVQLSEAMRSTLSVLDGAREKAHVLRGDGTWGYAFPVGMLLAAPQGVVLPNTLICDGSSVLKADYPDLFDVLGPMFGASDDRFNLPDLVSASGPLWCVVYQ